MSLVLKTVSRPALAPPKTGVARLRRVIVRNSTAYLFLLPALLTYALFAWYPIIKGFILSFQNVNLTPGSSSPWVGFDNYRTLFADPLFGTAWANTVKFTAYALIAGYIIPISLALAISEMRHGRAFFRAAFYLPVVLPPLVSVFVWQWFYDPNPTGFFNEVLGWIGIGPQAWIADPGQAMGSLVAVATWAAAGGTMLIYLAALQGIPAHLYEAAEIDGASFWGRLFHITLPQIRVIMLIMLVLQIIATMQIFTEPWALTGGGPANATTTVMILLYNSAFTYGQWGEASALGVVLFFVLGFFSILYFIVTRRFTRI
jgi:multiple sugar transport system permease protein